MELFGNMYSENSSIPDSIKYELPDADVVLINSVFTQNESKILFNNLIKKITWRQDKIKIFGKLIDQPRLTAFYGDASKPYSYSGIIMNPVDWNDDLLFIKTRIEPVAMCQFSSVLLNYYRDGNDSMGWHADDEKELGVNPVIASVSFGETRMFQMKHRVRKDIHKLNIPLPSGSLLLMKGITQHNWLHQIPKTSRKLAPRINLTFRNIVL
jgi:alkylated DNA repair dioxygenase AlkB